MGPFAPSSSLLLVVSTSVPGSTPDFGFDQFSVQRVSPPGLPSSLRPSPVFGPQSVGPRTRCFRPVPRSFGLSNSVSASVSVFLPGLLRPRPPCPLTLHPARKRPLLSALRAPTEGRRASRVPCDRPVSSRPRGVELPGVLGPCTPFPVFPAVAVAVVVVAEWDGPRDRDRASLSLTSPPALRGRGRASERPSDRDARGGRASGAAKVSAGRGGAGAGAGRGSGRRQGGLRSRGRGLGRRRRRPVRREVEKTPGVPDLDRRSTTT